MEIDKRWLKACYEEYCRMHPSEGREADLFNYILEMLEAEVPYT